MTIFRFKITYSDDDFIPLCTEEIEVVTHDYNSAFNKVEEIAKDSLYSGWYKIEFLYAHNHS